jgi:hypothetical protein
VLDLERRDDEDGAAGRQPVEVAQAGQPVLVGLMDQRVGWERRLHAAGLAGVGADRL